MIHPGYGFLSENPNSPGPAPRRASRSSGRAPELLELMGDKTAARASPRKSACRCCRGRRPVTDRAEALRIGKEIGFPLIIKAAFGGGGRGMRVVERAGGPRAPARRGAARGGRAFGNPAVFLEKYIPRAKHIEVQILGDRTATWSTCTSATARSSAATRRSSRSRPAPVPRPGRARRAVRRGRAARRGIGYDNAGTVEFLYDADTGSGSSSR
jgi:pyruvate carboxylase